MSRGYSPAVTSNEIGVLAQNLQALHEFNLDTLLAIGSISPRDVTKAELVRDYGYLYCKSY